MPKKKKSESRKPAAKKETKKALHREIPNPSFNLSILTWIAAGVILGIAILTRSYAFNMPVVGDESVYGILGKKAIEGAALYKDIYEMKPPLLFYVYGISTAIFGWGTASLRLIGSLLVVCNSFLIYSIARRYASASFSALVGSTCFFFLNNVYAFATETAAEHFFLLFVLSGYYLLINPRLRNLDVNTFIAGFLIAGGAMIKQTAALFGVGAIILLLWYSFSRNPSYAKKRLTKNISFLALGAIAMIALNLLPLVISGTLSYARYWLIEFPAAYTSKKSLSDSWVNLEFFGSRILKYQFYTILLSMLAMVSMVVNFRKRYFPLLIIFLVVGILIVFPGYRFYSQYWITLMTISALILISLKDALAYTRIKERAEVIVAILVLVTVTIDTISHRSEYFEKTYMVNAEKAYSGNFPFVHLKMIEFMQAQMQESDRFLMLGSFPFTYYMMDQFPQSNHIYPRLIFRDTPQNAAYQKEAIQEMQNGGQEYILYSVTGLSWRISGDGIDDWYQSAFRYIRTNYEPILAYDFDQRKYLYNTSNDKIDIYKASQLIALKKR